MIILTCAKHGLMFNSLFGCPDCNFEHRVSTTPPLAREKQSHVYPYRCVCGSRCRRPQGCTRNACAKKHHYFRELVKWKRCSVCGGKTKYDGYCTRYACRQIAGTIGMYYRRH